MERLKRIAREIAIAETALRRDEVARLQKRLEAQARKRLEKKLKRQLDSLWKQIEEYIKTHGVTPDLADEAIDWDRWQVALAVSIRGELRDLLKSVGTQVDSVIGVAANWDISQDQAVVDWLDRRTAELVVQVTEETRAAIRDVVRANYLNWIGTDVRTMARDLRPIVGLTRYQAQVVQNYRARLEAEKARGIYRSPAEIERMVANKAERIKRYRCRLIADTESVFAANEGALAVYRANPAVTAKQWYVTSDNPCPECAALDGQILGLDEVYAKVEVKKNGVPEWRDVIVPPLHPNCGCRVLPVTVDTVQDEEFWRARKERFARLQGGG